MPWLNAVPHQRIWQRVTSTTDPSGNTIYQTNAYNELATGLCYWNGQNWADSSEQIQITPNGAVATNGQHQVAHLRGQHKHRRNAIDLLTPDSQHMRSHITGLAYFDSATSNSVMIAELQDSIGQLLQSLNQVLYTNAFTDFQADIRYEYRIGGFEQDIILRQQPPPPSAYGLNPQVPRACKIWTRVYRSPRAAGNVLDNESKDRTAQSATGLWGDEDDAGPGLCRWGIECSDTRWQNIGV